MIKHRLIVARLFFFQILESGLLLEFAEAFYPWNNGVTSSTGDSTTVF
jgi:hypothetical protein